MSGLGYSIELGRATPAPRSSPGVAGAATDMTRSRAAPLGEWSILARQSIRPEPQNVLGPSGCRSDADCGGDPNGYHEKVKAETDGDISMSGSATTVRWLLREGLLDELRLLIHPVAVGKGQRLFEDTDLTKLRLVDQRALGSGVLYVAYAPA
jgi:RibD C-terminal domain